MDNQHREDTQILDKPTHQPWAKPKLIICYVIAVVLIVLLGSLSVDFPQQYETWKSSIQRWGTNNTAAKTTGKEQSMRTTVSEESMRTTVSEESMRTIGSEESMRGNKMTNLYSELGMLTPTHSLIKGNKNYIINCSNVAEIKIGKLLGTGNRKSVYLGTFRGEKVAVKIVGFESRNFVKCKNSKKSTPFHVDCYNYPYLMALTEIVLHNELKYPGFTPLLGYCVKDVFNPPLKDVPANQQALVSVFEFGDEYSTEMDFPLSKRLQFAVDLCETLEYLEHSPLGSLYMLDFKPINHRIHSGHLKLSDIERLTYKGKGGRHSNAENMMKLLRDFFFPHLLSCKEASTDICIELSQLKKDENNTASEAKHKLLNLMKRI